MSKVKIKRIHSLEELMNSLKDLMMGTESETGAMLNALKDAKMSPSQREEYDQLVYRHEKLRLTTKGANLLLAAMGFLDGIDSMERGKKIKAKVKTIEEENQLADTVWEIIKKSTEEFHAKLIELNILEVGK